MNALARRLTAWWVVAVMGLAMTAGCGSSATGCPGEATECPSSCVAVEGSRVDLDQLCIEPLQTVACITRSAAEKLSAVQTCLTRSRDGAVMLLKGDVALPADQWVACESEASYQAAAATARCM